jgi:hypothetical protein
MNKMKKYDPQKRPLRKENITQVIDIQSKYIIEWE